MPSIIYEFKLSYGLGGLFSGAFGMPVLVLSIPASLFVQRFNLRKTIIATSLLSIIGSLIISLTHNILLLFIGRFLEGVGMALALVASPYLISRAMVETHVILGMGVLMMFNPLGNVLSMVLSSLLYAFSWRAIWLTGIILPLISLILSSRIDQIIYVAPKTSASLVEVFKERDVYLVSLFQLGLTFSSMGYLMWLPTCLNEVHKFNISLASFLTSLFMAIGIPAPLVASYLISRFKSPKKVLAACFAFLSLLLPFTTHINESILALYIIVLGFFAGLTPTIIHLYMAKIFGSSSSVGFGIINMLRGFSLLFGPAVMGVIRDITNSWDLSFFFLSIFTVVSFIASFLLQREIMES
ncbi:MAG: MFS transporter [Candidatus Bathyarchaeia archaeon]